MSGPATIVLDASVGVKWFRKEAGSSEAAALYGDAVAGRVRLTVPVHFMHEFLSVLKRELGPAAVPEGWDYLEASGLNAVPLTHEVVSEAAAQCEALGCSFYDALSPALASLLGGELVSADARAHGAYPGVRLIG
ncbi:MAG: hypothetical protein C0418_01695 [Coriobacteriaceae bacterium]|nr:hypothetical protein [Coriobacteriaceae bacterium]